MEKYYLLGIGGVSMSALAIMLKNRGCLVRGSDEVESEATKMLQAEGIEVDFKFNPQKISESSAVVFSSAIKPNNKQFIFAKKLGKKMFSRGQLLGEISNDYEKVIAIAGSHGKTTTTAMIYEILNCAGKQPTLHLGGYRIEDGRNFVLGQKEFFITEACEYHDNFLQLMPYMSVITNIEKEHMDYFKTFENQIRSFKKFKCNSLFVVDDISELSAKNVKHNKKGFLSFDIVENGKKVLHLNMLICEDVNTQNCLFAYKVAKKLNISNCLIKLGLEKFQGVKNRFEKKQSRYFETVICDYAHHPTEIKRSIIAAKKIYKNKEVVTIFQPHTYSRTKSLLNEFLAVFKNVKNPIFFKTYSARETESEGIGANKFTEILKKTNKNAKYFDNFEELFKFLINWRNKDVVLLFIGAGDLPQILHKNSFIS